MREWWPVACVFVLVAAILAFVFTADWLGRRAVEQEAEPAGEEVEEDVLALFWQAVKDHQPDYTPITQACPVDGTEFEVPSQVHDNRFGGVATDLMKIALSPPKGENGSPITAAQQWEGLLATCPGCGATYMEVDLINLRGGMVPGAADAIKGWDLAEAAPQLADRPHGDWTVDERILVRYLTLRRAGFPGYELGFYALSGAYAGNFAAYTGADCHIPSPAFYALAAAHMREELEGKHTKATVVEQSLTAMTLGELYRLLGRTDDAASWFAHARGLGGLDERTAVVLGQLEGLLAGGDTELHRAELPGVPEPPTGWYIDEMLPAINEHLKAHRAEWAGEDDPDEILALIMECL